MGKTPKEKGYMSLGYLTDPELVCQVMEAHAKVQKKIGCKVAMNAFVAQLIKRGIKGLV